MNIRPWTRDDLSAITRLLSSLAESISYTYHGDTSLLEKQYDLMSMHPELYTSLVYSIGENVVGFVSAVYYPSVFHNKGTALITELVVDEGYRNRGIGRELVSYIINEAKERGYDEVEVGLVIQNKKAKRFYGKCGFDEEYILLGMEFDKNA